MQIGCQSEEESKSLFMTKKTVCLQQIKSICDECRCNTKAEEHEEHFAYEAHDALRSSLMLLELHTTAFNQHDHANVPIIYSLPGFEKSFLQSL